MRLFHFCCRNSCLHDLIFVTIILMQFIIQTIRFKYHGSILRQVTFSLTSEPPQFSYASSGADNFGQNKIEDSCKPVIALLLFGFKFVPIIMYSLSYSGTYSLK